MPIIGTQQSPIRIVHDETSRVNFAGHLTHGYDRALSGTFQGDNFVFQAPPPCAPETPDDTLGKTLSAGNQEWIIRKIHIHAPAEHVVVQHQNDDDKFAPFEFHLVHSLAGDVKGRGPKLVLGVFFKVVAKVSKGAKDRSSLYALNEKISLAVTKQGDKAACKIVHAHDINPAHFLPDDDQSLKQFYRYEGSLTTEPFSEDVSWYVVRGHAAVSKTQVNQLQICAEQEARPAHALDRRFILRSF